VAWLVLPVDRSFPSGGPGRGLGNEAACVMWDWFFGSAGAERIESSTAVSNSRMRGVFDKLGFGFDGVKRRWDVDRAHYSVSREQWNVDRS
jgi:RimJ/RimL family protein N-acetyltransferase